jgi:predicted RNA-binding protein YlqC (UPF0109 family)
MKDTLLYIINSIVEKTDEVEVIGKEGKVIKAIRNLMRIPAVLQNKKIYISLADR